MPGWEDGRAVSVMMLYLVMLQVSGKMNGLMSAWDPGGGRPCGTRFEAGAVFGLGYRRI